MIYIEVKSEFTRTFVIVEKIAIKTRKVRILIFGDFFFMKKRKLILSTIHDGRKYFKTRVLVVDSSNLV